jgi:hypothetical protein
MALLQEPKQSVSNIAPKIEYQHTLIGNMNASLNPGAYRPDPHVHPLAHMRMALP